MGGSAVFVDVDAVGLVVEKHAVGPQGGKQTAGRGAGRSVGAVHRQAHAPQIHVGHVQQVADIIVHRVVTAGHPANIAAGGGGRRLRAVQDNRLDFLLQVVGQLIALAVENLDTIVFAGVVRRGNHDARVRLILAHQVSHRRRGHHAQQLHVGAHRAQPGHQRRLQHIGGHPGILADEHPRTPVLHLDEHHGGGPSNRHGRLTG